MNGYRIYYDESQNKYLCDASKTEVQSSNYDFEFWVDLPLEQAKERAEDCTKERVPRIRYCKDCGKSYIFTVGEEEWYKDRGYDCPKRCETCRKMRKGGRR